MIAQTLWWTLFCITIGIPPCLLSRFLYKKLTNEGHKKMLVTVATITVFFVSAGLIALVQGAVHTLRYGLQG